MTSNLDIIEQVLKSVSNDKVCKLINNYIHTDIITYDDLKNYFEKIISSNLLPVSNDNIFYIIKNIIPLEILDISLIITNFLETIKTKRSDEIKIAMNDSAKQKLISESMLSLDIDNLVSLMLNYQAKGIINDADLVVALYKIKLDGPRLSRNCHIDSCYIDNCYNTHNKLFTVIQNWIYKKIPLDLQIIANEILNFE
jgi:hypothetical protein